MSEQLTERKKELLEICFDCFCENGLENTGIKKLGAACGMSTAGLFYFFSNKDAIIIEATAHCMSKVEDDFMAHAPQSIEDLERFFCEMPYLTARLHGSKYRFMYQVYASPQYREHGVAFFKGVAERYEAYAEQISPKLGIDVETLQGFIYIFVRASVHFAIFEDEKYLHLQLKALRASLSVIWKLKELEAK